LHASANDPHLELKNGTISYFDKDGARKTVEVGSQCADLWVAPDESIFTFISMDRTSGPDSYGQLLIESSSIYTAEREDNYTPKRLPIKPVRDYDRDWEVFLNPKVLPDRGTVIFKIPVSVTSGDLFAYDAKTKMISKLEGAVEEYCTVWNGPMAGVILVQHRQMTDVGPTYACNAVSVNGKQTRLTEHCDDFDKFLTEWSRTHGQQCY
jgi:hypothetical protein